VVVAHGAPGAFGMNEDLARLAPPIDPSPPPLAADGAALAVVVLAVGGVLLAVLFALVLYRLWWRWRLARALQRVDVHGPAVAAAQDIAALARRFAVPAPPQWWTAIDAIRFAPERGAEPAGIARLRDAVPTFGRRRR
jgi:hypothetical protein